MQSLKHPGEKQTVRTMRRWNCTTPNCIHKEEGVDNQSDYIEIERFKAEAFDRTGVRNKNDRGLYFSGYKDYHEEKYLN